MLIRCIRTFGVVLAAALLALASGECVLRASMSITGNSPTFVADPDIGFRMRPNIVVTSETLNSSGFNDREHPPSKPGGAIRLAFIGDSFVFGVVPRPANFTSVVQRLSDTSAANVEVLNIGLPAAGPKNYLRMIDKDAAEQQADIVVVVLFLVERRRAETFERNPSAFVRDCYASTVDVAERMRDAAQKRGMKFFVVLAPDEIQVEPGLQTAVRQSFDLDAADYDFAGASHRLADNLGRAGILVLDLLPVFEAAQSSKSLYAERDTHWNEAGNELAGETIWDLVSQAPAVVMTLRQARQRLPTATKLRCVGPVYS
jgi:hypothetical protein